MDGVESYAELLASVGAPGFVRFAELGWQNGAAIDAPPCGYGHPYAESEVDTGLSSWGSECSSEDGGDDADVDEADDEEGAAGFPATDGDSHGDEDGQPSSGVLYASACDNFAEEMRDAAAAQAPRTFIPTKSLYIKRKRTAKGVEPPSCRPPSEVGAVETALRASASKKTAHIFHPTPGLVFDSVEEAYEFYNLYSWEVGFGIRYGRSNNNSGNRYRSMQQIECANGGKDTRCKYQSQRCECRASMKLLRTEDHGWYVSQLIEDHNHVLSECCGEKKQWKSHRSIDAYTKDIIRGFRCG